MSGPGLLYCGVRRGPARGSWCAHSLLVLPGSPGSHLETRGPEEPTPVWTPEVGLEETAPRNGLDPVPRNPRLWAGWEGSLEVSWFILLPLSQVANTGMHGITSSVVPGADITNQALHTLLQKWLPDLFSTSLQAAMRGLMALA